jgi:UDP-glucose 4-epimerase
MRKPESLRTQVWRSCALEGTKGRGGVVARGGLWFFRGPERLEEEIWVKVLVTGANGKVGGATVTALIERGHEVRSTDLQRGVFERPELGAPEYIQADLTDAGEAYAVSRDMEAIVHPAAIPEPTHNSPHVVFKNNLMATFNMIEAAIRLGATRFVNISSETVPGFFFPEREFLADYVPIDEEHPIRPQDPYALSKYFGELLMDAAIRRSDIRCISIRPSWVQHEGNYERNLGPHIRDESLPSPSFWSYIDLYDLADALCLAAESNLEGHEVFYIASPDNAGGRDLAQMVKAHHGDKVEVRSLARPDASGTSSAKAERMLGYSPTRSWRDYLDDEGRLKPNIG